MKNKLLNFIEKNASILRFVIVGFVNTLNYYMIYLFFMHLGFEYLFSHSFAFGISMIGSFYLNCYFTYKAKPTWKKFIQFPMTYVVNFTVSTLSLYVIVDLLSMNEFIAPIIASILPIPFTYIVSKFILEDKKTT